MAIRKKHIAYAVIICLVIVNFVIFTNIVTDKPLNKLFPEETVKSSESASDAEDGGSAGEVAELSPDSKYINVNVSDTHSGSLILVNKENAFVFDNAPWVVKKESIVSVFDARGDNRSYYVSNRNVSMDETAVGAFTFMMNDFYASTGNKDVIVTQGYRTYDEQQKMLELKISQYGPDQTIAQTPGYSEHHTGLALDISTYEKQIMDTFTGDGVYKWIPENAHKYGFVLRYPADKEHITGISYESWHYRYVGVPHAKYMYSEGLVLEEYIELLETRKYGGSELVITDEVTGDIYSVYSVAVPADGTPVPVPSSTEEKEVMLSGDNCGNIIVTVKETVTAE